MTCVQISSTRPSAKKLWWRDTASEQPGGARPRLLLQRGNEGS